MLRGPRLATAMATYADRDRVRLGPAPKTEVCELAYFEAVFIPSDRWICGRGLLVAVLHGQPAKSRPRLGARAFGDDELRLKGGMRRVVAVSYQKTMPISSSAKVRLNN